MKQGTLFHAFCLCIFAILSAHLAKEHGNTKAAVLTELTV